MLRGASLELRAGQSLALVGSSGSGKTTLLRIIAGLEAPQRGEVFLGGKLGTQDGRILTAPCRRNVAMLFQDGALWPNLSIAENVRLGLSGLPLTRQEIRRRTVEALARCGLTDLAERLPGTLSGGQQQRAALARALAAQPKLLLLDEPFGGLDLITKQSVVDQIATLRTQAGFALILVTHDPGEIGRLCDGLAVLENGEIVERGRLAEIAAHPRTALAQAIVRLLGRSGP